MLQGKAWDSVSMQGELEDQHKEDKKGNTDIITVKSGA